MTNNLAKLVVRIDRATKRDLEEIARREDRSVASLLRAMARHIAASHDVMQADRAERIANATREAIAERAGNTRRR